MFGGGFSPSPVERQLQAAFGLLQQGRVGEAEAAFGEVLRLDSRNALAHHLLGLIALQTGRPQQGLASLHHAIALDPRDPTAWGNLGNALRETGAVQEAMDAYDRALAMAPGFVDAHNNRAILLRGIGRLDEALAGYDRALALEPRAAKVHNNRGDALIALGRPVEALASYDRAVELDSGNAETHYNRANVLAEMRRAEEAVAGFSRALALDPRHVQAYVNRGNLLLDLDRNAEALADYDRALALQGDLAAAYSNRASALRNLERRHEALESADRALALDPANAAAHTNRANALLELNREQEALEGYDRALSLQANQAQAYSNRVNALREMGRHSEALASAEQAIALDPRCADPLINRATVLREMGRYGEMIDDLAQALELEPQSAQARFNIAAGYLTLGDFERGWILYEGRKGVQGAAQILVDRGFAEPEWTPGTELAGKTLLLHSEQGLGDSLQFCRFAAEAGRRGARVLLEVEPPLVGVLSTLEGVDRVLAKGEPLPPFDLHAYLMSAPLALGTTPDSIPATIPYLHADPAKSAAWAERLGPRGRLRVGLVWSGGHRPNLPGAANLGRRRNIALAALAPLAAADAEFYSLQKGQPAEGELAALKARGWDGPDIIDRMGEIGDFTDTAALIDNLDLVIAVDTSTAHLAGALGKPTWLLNRFDTCWRWMLERDDTPWYPTMRLFRQERFDDWAPVVRTVAAELKVLAGRWTAP